MKITDFIFRFKSYHFICPYGICRVRIFVNSKSEIFTVITELDENTSSSVTNSIEYIYNQLLEEQKISKESTILDHYPSHLWFGEEFSIVNFSENLVPQWEDISYKKVLSLLECSKSEFDNYKEDARIRKEIYDAVHGIPKIQTYQYVEPPEISERRLEITKNQHSKINIKELLDTFPDESELSAFLKKDMSVLAENYAFNEDEYICFSEFPVDTGRVDFVVFTGRSRMNVYLIEIKGANKNLCRKNHYAEFRQEIQEGRGQLIQRSAWITSNYNRYRKFVHDVYYLLKMDKDHIMLF